MAQVMPTPLSPKGSEFTLDHFDQEKTEAMIRIAEVFKITFSDPAPLTENVCFNRVIQACKENDSKKIQSAEDAIVKIRDVSGRTLLMHAVAAWDKDLIKYLCQFKIIYHQKDIEGNNRLSHV